jgi:hypothetical protein
VRTGVQIERSAGCSLEPRKRTPFGGEQAVNAGQQRAPSFLREVEHDVAQEDDVEAVGCTVEGKRRAADVGLAKVAVAAHLGLREPVFADVVEVANDEARGQASVDFDAMVAAGLCAFHDFAVEIGALDRDLPAGEQGKVLEQKHGHAVGFLAGGAGGAPDAQPARVLARLDELGKQLRAQQVEGADVAEEAGFVDGHGLGNLSLEGRIA